MLVCCLLESFKEKVGFFLQCNINKDQPEAGFILRMLYTQKYSIWKSAGFPTAIYKLLLNKTEKKCTLTTTKDKLRCKLFSTQDLASLNAILYNEQRESISF